MKRRAKFMAIIFLAILFALVVFFRLPSNNEVGAQLQNEDVLCEKERENGFCSTGYFDDGKVIFTSKPGLVGNCCYIERLNLDRAGQNLSNFRVHACGIETTTVNCTNFESMSVYKKMFLVDGVVLSTDRKWRKNND